MNKPGKYGMRILMVCIALAMLSLLAPSAYASGTGTPFFFNIGLAGPSVIDLAPVAGSDFAPLSILEVSANVTGGSPIDTVLAIITLPNASNITLTLTNSAGDIFNSSFGITDLTGTYAVQFIANDTLAKINDTEITFFTISTPAAPGVPSGGGGGGRAAVDECTLNETRCSGNAILTCTRTTAGNRWHTEICDISKICSEGKCVDEICNEDWICDTWSDCKQGIKTRDCEDFNNCGTEIDKPKITLECGIQAINESPTKLDARSTINLSDTNIPIIPGKIISHNLWLLYLLMLLAILAGSWTIIDRKPSYKRYIPTLRKTKRRLTPTTVQKKRLIAALRKLTETMRAVLAPIKNIFEPINKVIAPIKDVIETMMTMFAPTKKVKAPTEPETDPVFEKGNGDEIYVPISYVHDADKAFDILLSSDSKTATKKLRGMPPLVNSLCKKILSEKITTYEKPVLDIHYDYMTLKTFHIMLRQMVIAKRNGLAYNLTKNQEQSQNENAPPLDDGYFVLPIKEELIEHYKVTRVELTGKKSCELIRDLTRNKDTLIVIDISKLAKDLNTLKKQVHKIKHTAKACDAQVVGLDENTILVVCDGLKLHLDR